MRTRKLAAPPATGQFLVGPLRAVMLEVSVGLMAGRPGSGFASMSKERVRELGRKGGQTAHASGTAYTWSPEEARRAGKRGGRASGDSRRRAEEERYERAKRIEEGS